MAFDCEITDLVIPTATDDCGGEVTIINDATLPMTIPGVYTVAWTFTDSEGNETIETQDVTIALTEACLDLVTVNDVITPNGDGDNDYWVLENISYTEGCNVQVFNRWGAQVFETDGYDNTWDGTSEGGEILPEGVYYYIIQCNDNVSFRGYITIVR
jgi:gliding motility-associated-like protein